MARNKETVARCCAEATVMQARSIEPNVLCSAATHASDLRTPAFSMAHHTCMH